MHWSIKQQLIVGGLVSCILAVAIAVFSFLGLTRAEVALQEVVENSVVLSNHQEADMMHDALRGDVLSALLSGAQGGKNKDAIVRDTQEHVSAFRKALAENKTLATEGPIKAELAATEAEMEKYSTLAQSIVSQAFSDLAGASARYDEFVGEFGKLEGQMARVSASIEKQNHQVRESGIHDATAMRKLVLTVSVVSVGIILIVSFVVPRQVTRALASIREIGDTMAAASLNRDLSVRADESSRGEVGLLAKNVNSILENVSSSLRQISHDSAQLVESAREVVSVSQEASDGVQRQQSETAQVATAVNEMSMSVQEVARNAAQAAEAAALGDSESKHGRGVVVAAIGAMDQLSQQVDHTVGFLLNLKADSANIGTVLDVIKSIAEQTNLLALNAAIEAARAGEQGRGFAVVADEVRTLAQRTQKSTSEIQDMIHRLQTGVAQVAQTMEQGQVHSRATSEKVLGAAKSLESIAGAVGTIAEISTQIAAATEEQGTVAEEINRNISSISDAAEQSAQGAHRAVRATAEISDLAKKLNEQVKLFKLA